MPSTIPYVLVLLAPRLFVTALLAIVFTQSAADKLLDWKGNQAFLAGHFAKSPLRGLVPALLGALTLLELAAGLLCIAGALELLVGRGTALAFYGLTASCVALTALLFGQRLAKDYAGAAGLIPYCLLALAGLWTLR